MSKEESSIIHNGVVYKRVDSSGFITKNNVLYQSTGESIDALLEFKKNGNEFVKPKKKYDYKSKREAVDAPWERDDKGGFHLKKYLGLYDISVEGKFLKGKYTQYSWTVTCDQPILIPENYRHKLYTVGERLNGRYFGWECSSDRKMSCMTGTYGSHVNNTKVSAIRYIQLCEAFRTKSS